MIRKYNWDFITLYTLVHIDGVVYYVRRGGGALDRRRHMTYLRRRRTLSSDSGEHWSITCRQLLADRPTKAADNGQRLSAAGLCSTADSGSTNFCVPWPTSLIVTSDRQSVGLADHLLRWEVKV